MDRNSQKIALINLLALLLAAAGSATLAYFTSSSAAHAGVLFFGYGLFISLVSYFQLRLEAREVVERLEYHEAGEGAGSALFEQEAEHFPARRARLQFEKFFIPALTFILFLLQGLGAYWVWRREPLRPNPGHALLAIIVYGLFSLILFLLGKYSAGLARLAGDRLLRPAAGYLMLGSFLSFALGLTEACIWFGFPQVDHYVARGLAVVLALAAAESLVNLVLEIYRPRVQGQEARLLYESRLVGLLGQPGGLITTAAQALDYQFGFKVSETWLYRFLEKAIAWIILLQVAVLVLSTTFVVIEPPEQGLLERWGKPAGARALLEPGLHLKWPWPIEQVHRYNTRAVQTFEVGFVPEKTEEKERVILWTRAHYKDEVNMLVASRTRVFGTGTNSPGSEQTAPVNLLTVSIPVQFQVTNLTNWVYLHTDATSLLEKVATREVVRYLVSVDFDEILAGGRIEAARALRDRIQAKADEEQLGAKIILVGLQDIHPPVGGKVAESFEQVIGAIQNREARILTAEGERAKSLPEARAEAVRLKQEAESRRSGKVLETAALAARFTNQLAAYKASPSVFTNRAYLETLSRALASTRKIILAMTNRADVLNLNLERNIREDLLNPNQFTVPGLTNQTSGAR